MLCQRKQVVVTTLLRSDASGEGILWPTIAMRRSQLRVASCNIHPQPSSHLGKQKSFNLTYLNFKRCFLLFKNCLHIINVFIRKIFCKNSHNFLSCKVWEIVFGDEAWLAAAGRAGGLGAARNSRQDRRESERKAAGLTSLCCESPFLHLSRTQPNFLLSVLLPPKTGLSGLR